MDSATLRVAGKAITLQDETGADALTVSSLGAAGALLDTGGAAHNVRAYGARGDGVTDDTPALVAAADAPGGGPALIGPGTYRVGSNLTLGRQLTIPEGATLKPDAGVTITLRGIDAGRYRVFDLSGGGAVRWERGTAPSVVYPEWWGAVADGVADCTDALHATAAAVSGAGGGCTVSLAPNGTYYIGQYQGSTPVDAIIFADCVGLSIEGNGATLESTGSFHRTATTGYSVALQFRRCARLIVRNLECDGNLQDTTRDPTVLETSRGHGLSLYACTDVLLENLYLHRWNGDGLYISSISVGGQQRVCRRVYARNVVCSHNARQGMSIVGLNGGLFANCEFAFTGRTDLPDWGNYGGHSPRFGVDVEPNYIPPTVDLLTGEITFQDCQFLENYSMGFGSDYPLRTYRVRLKNCYVKSSAAPGATHYAFVLNCPGGLVEDTLMDLGDKAVYAQVNGVVPTSRTTYRNVEIRSSTNGFLSTTLQPVRLERVRFIGTHTAPTSTYFPYIQSNAIEAEDCYIFVPKEAYNGSGTYHEVSSWRPGRSVRTRFETDLEGAPAAHFANNYGTASEVVNDRFPANNKFRQRFNSAWDHSRPVSIRHLSTVGNVTRGYDPVSTPWDAPALAPGDVASTTVTVAGATWTDLWEVGASSNLQGCQVWARTTNASTNEVTIYVRNPNAAGSINLPLITYHLYRARTA